MTPTSKESRVLVEKVGHVLQIGLNRPHKANAADAQLLGELALAYGMLERDPHLRVGLVYAVGEHFTAGLDLADIAPRVTADGLDLVPDGGIDPWGISTPPVSKPVVLAVHGICFTLGIELMLASDIVVAADDTRFAQLEVARGILPFGGATLRFAQRTSWGNAMRWMLTGDEFSAHDALAMGLVQLVCSPGEQREHALVLAERIAAQAPLAVQATLASARRAESQGAQAAAAALQPTLVSLMKSKDAAIGMKAFLAREDAVFIGE